MSHAGAILGINELIIEQVHRYEGIEVWAKPSKRPHCKHCASNKLRVKATHNRTVKHTRQGNQVMTLHLKVPKYHCPDCGRYFRHPFRGIKPRYRSSEAFQMEVFEAHHEGVTQRKLSRSHGISSATVERWYQSHIHQKYSEKDRRSCPRVLGIDEHFFTRKKGYATTFVDLKHHKVFDVQLGRSEASLRRYLSCLRGRDNVQLIVMDLSETYRNIAKRYFPNATIIADRFHVVRLINYHFLKAWKGQDEEGRKSRGLLSLMRRHQWHLSEEKHKTLMSYLAEYPVLKELYEVKQKLIKYILHKAVNERYMRQLLPDFLKLIKQMEFSPLKGLAKTLTSWLQPILAMWRYNRSNGMTEGFHNKMEMLSRRAYGFRNFENYRLRVMTHCGWDGIINRVR
jgi:transposase